MQAFLANFVYRRRTEDIYAQGQEVLLHLHQQNNKLLVELSEANATAKCATKMMDLAAGSLEQVEGYNRKHDGEVAKLKEELNKERASHDEA